MPGRTAKKLNKKSHELAWKKTSAKAKRTKQTKRALVRYVVVIMLFFASIVTIAGFWSYRKLTSNFVWAASATSADILTEDIFTLATYYVADFETYEVESIDFSIFDVKNKKIITYKIAADSTFDVAGKYAEEPASKLLSLGIAVESGDTAKATQLANTTLENYFGLSIDKHMLVNSPLHTNFSSLVRNGDINSTLSFDFLSTLSTETYTNLAVNEGYYVYKFLKSLPSDRFYEKPLESQANFDQELHDITYDGIVALEEQSVAVLNGTEATGVANFGARVASNLGARVIAEGNASQPYDKTYLVASDASLETARELADFFNIAKISLKNESGAIYESEFDRADIILILGVDALVRL